MSIDIPHPSVDEFVTKIDVNCLIYCLSLTNWDALFIGCKSVDNFAQCFHDELQTVLSNTTYTTIKRTRPNLPKHILKLFTVGTKRGSLLNAQEICHSSKWLEDWSEPACVPFGSRRKRIS